MATVRFTIPDEFLAELEKDQRLVQRGIVRITHLYRDSTFSPIIRHLSVVATTRIDDDVVCCECDCDLWQMADNDRKVTANPPGTGRGLRSTRTARAGRHCRGGRRTQNSEE
jgi:hypothetical protein